MIQIKLEDSNHGFRHLVNQLSTKNMNVANVRAINKGIAKGNTEYKRVLTSQYNITANDAGKMLSSVRASYQTPTGIIKADVKPVNLGRFNPTFVKGGQILRVKALKAEKGKKRALEQQSKRTNKKEGGGVSLQIKKGKTESLPSAFMLTKQGKYGGMDTVVWGRGTYKGVGNFMWGNFKPRESEWKTKITPLKSLSAFSIIRDSNYQTKIKTTSLEDAGKEFQRQVQLMLRK